MSKSTYLSNKFLDAVYGQTALPAIAIVYVALYTATPNASGGGTEVSGSNYSRVAVTNNTTNWPNASSATKSNANIITFPTPSGSWGIITHFGIFDAAASGNLLDFGALTSSMAAGLNNSVSIAIGALTMTES